MDQVPPGLAGPGSEQDVAHVQFRGIRGQGHFPIPLLKGRYGEGIIMRAYNNLPVDRTNNGGFGRNESSTHFHNAHNGAEATAPPTPSTSPGPSTTTIGGPR